MGSTAPEPEHVDVLIVGGGPVGMSSHDGCSDNQSLSLYS